MKTLPMLYSIRELVLGEGFVASVELDGRALATEEEADEWWIYGVNPGAIAASGQTIREAFAALQASFRAYLRDCAASELSFDTFKREVERFFRETDPESLDDWDKALQAVRAGATTPEDLGKQSVDASPRRVRVQLVATPTPVRDGVGGDFGIAA